MSDRAPLGRPTVYQSDYPEKAAKLCALGATDAQIADFFEVNTLTIYRWKHKYPEFCSALKVAKEAADTSVERSLYNRAVGYSFPSVKIFNDKGVIVEAPYTEHAPPDVTACIFWLKNRQPAVWRDRTDQANTGNVTVIVKKFEDDTRPDEPT